MGSGQEQYEEVLDFLKDKRSEVQYAAAEALLGFTEESSFLEYCRQCPRLVARPMLRIIEKDPLEVSTKDARQAALKCLVNLAGVPAVCSELVELRAPGRCIDVLRTLWLDGNADDVHWFTMLLANLSTTEKGQAAFAVNSKDLMFVLSLYIGEVQPKPTEDFKDRLLWAGKTLQNVCAAKCGRAVIVAEVPGLRRLAKELVIPARRHRRSEIMGIFKNLCNDKECHEAVIESGFFLRAACFLYPEGEPEDRRKALPEPVLEEMQGFTSDITIRRLGAEALFSLAGSEEGRLYLHENGCYELLRAWHEKEKDDDTIKLITDAVPLVFLTEEDLKKGITMVPAKDEGIELQGPAAEQGQTQQGPDRGEVGEDEVIYPPASSHAFSASSSKLPATPEDKAERVAKAKEHISKCEDSSASVTEASGSKGGGYAASNPPEAPAKVDLASENAGEEKMEIGGLFDDISSDDEKDKK